MNALNWTRSAPMWALALSGVLVGCGDHETVASKSARAYREARARGETVAEAGHGGHTVSDPNAEAGHPMDMGEAQHDEHSAAMTGHDMGAMPTGAGARPEANMSGHDAMAGHDMGQMRPRGRGAAMAGQHMGSMNEPSRGMSGHDMSAMGSSKDGDAMAGMAGHDMPGMTRGTDTGARRQGGASSSGTMSGHDMSAMGHSAGAATSGHSSGAAGGTIAGHDMAGMDGHGAMSMPGHSMPPASSGAAAQSGRDMSGMAGMEGTKGMAGHGDRQSGSPTAAAPQATSAAPGGAAAALRPDPADAPAGTSVAEAQRSAEIGTSMGNMGGMPGMHGGSGYLQRDVGRQRPPDDTGPQPHDHQQPQHGQGEGEQ